MARLFGKRVWVGLRLIALVGVFVGAGLQAKVPESLLGTWSLQLETEEPAWLKVEEEDGKPIVRMRVHVLGAGPHKDVRLEGDELVFSMKIKRQPGDEAFVTQNQVRVGVRDGRLQGLILCDSLDAPYDRIEFTGKKYPAMPAKPDLTKVKFGQAVTLFNGKDLAGWRLNEPNKTNGWSARDGLLVNTTPKTDFGSTGTFGNLRTEAVFEDFRLHIEFRPKAGQNSGVYLRGMYEVQVVDRDSRMQGKIGIGSVFSVIGPSHQAAGEPGTWQSYDLTLVDRHVTIVLNGETVVDNVPVDRPTGGAIHTDPMTAGPIFLQGDHTSIEYRNVYLEPVLE
ncbi:3-keto-disaccharide hydrolase [Pelagicoccus mobilis]|uniref:DUF1080 domain-containing protein n=1 Tax=Pelagicoccus mobilis TaxID=415221 RepID=A0A934S212_9BACT|nr:DUF1080 domain-containing protein [Pelagicoccus mobilis]MBK1877623.1 DUF1080 domain-containing protein [Pelagicoccus mobilis]